MRKSFQLDLPIRSSKKREGWQALITLYKNKWSKIDLRFLVLVIMIMSNFAVNAQDTLSKELQKPALNNVDSSWDIKVYPNPATREVCIESSGLIKYVELLDDLRILKMEKRVKATHKLILSLDEFSAGEYWLRIITNENDQVVRLLVKL